MNVVAAGPLPSTPFPQAAKGTPWKWGSGPCKRPIPRGLDIHGKVMCVVVCETCSYTLSLLEYESNGVRMGWWRHRDAPLAIA